MKQPLFRLCLLILLIGPAHHRAHAAEPGRSPAPVQVEANRMESLQQDKAVLFTGNVEARQGEILLHADEMTVHYQDSEAAAQKPGSAAEAANRKVDKLIARGNVKIQSNAWTASGDMVEFMESDRKVVLEGNAKVWRNNNLVTGDRVILYLDEGKSVVEKGSGSEGRVKAFFYPDQDDSEKSAAPPLDKPTD